MMRALRDLRIARGWSQYDAAAAMGPKVSQGFVSSLENCSKAFLRWDSVQRYARALGVRIVVTFEEESE